MTRPRKSFSPVSTGRSFELVRNALRQAIEAHELRPGDRLPAEPALAAEFGVSRSVLREALKALELSGDLEVKRGYGGGTFVAAPRTAEEHVPVTGLPDVTPAQLLEVRLALEPAAARLAALSGDAKARALREAVNDIEALDARPAHVLAADCDFHLAVAQATGNPVFAATLAGLRPACYRALNEPAQSPAWREQAREDHERIAFEIARRNHVLAETLMRKHIESEWDVRRAELERRGALAR
jgi:GntR family transcriptional regulator, transcriptional repressor for pyruvate dehydrogenase complex